MCCACAWGASSRRGYLNIIAGDKTCALPKELTSFTNWIFPFEKLRSDPSFNDEFVLTQDDEDKNIDQLYVLEVCTHVWSSKGPSVKRWAGWSEAIRNMSPDGTFKPPPPEAWGGLMLLRCPACGTPSLVRQKGMTSRWIGSFRSQTIDLASQASPR